MIDRSYPGQLDWCWPESTTLRRVQLSTVPQWEFRIWLVTQQHWSRCPELYIKLGRIRLDVLWSSGLLPQWHPQINTTICA